MSFLSFLKSFGHKIVQYSPEALNIGEVAVQLAFPALGPMFNTTANAVILAEQKYAALGIQNAGPQKLAEVIASAGPIIKLGLDAAGYANHDAAVAKYVNAVVAVLNTAPKPVA